MSWESETFSIEKVRYGTALEQDFIVVSAGLRGAQLKLAPDDLRVSTSAQVEDLL